ncbi:MAG: acetyl-CoA carboxylase biotin carboxyl carrier protein subunit [Firmicutes bacterium]|nr:acetyl-CoA carboxylase biotin carboxyl carrier protein subunit [Bacillota bacterium]
MKQFRVTVNGKTYDVVVEEVNGAETGKLSAASHSQAAGRPADAVAAGESVSTQEHAPAAAGEQKVLTGGTPLAAPMPGVVQRVAASVGQKVKAGETVIVLEAMKMENEIGAPVSGTVREILVSPGTTVNTGDIMLVIE